MRSGVDLGKLLKNDEAGKLDSHPTKRVLHILAQDAILNALKNESPSTIRYFVLANMPQPRPCMAILSREWQRTRVEIRANFAASFNL